MDPDSGESAAQWLARADEREIADVLWTYGEEKLSRRIARAIVARRGEKPLTRTAQLADLRRRVVVPRATARSIRPRAASRRSASTSIASWTIWKRASTPRMRA